MRRSAHLGKGELNISPPVVLRTPIYPQPPRGYQAWTVVGPRGEASEMQPCPPTRDTSICMGELPLSGCSQNPRTRGSLRWTSFRGSTGLGAIPTYLSTRSIGAGPQAG